MDIIEITVSASRKVRTAEYESAECYTSARATVGREDDPAQVHRVLTRIVTDWIDAEEARLRARAAGGPATAPAAAPAAQSPPTPAPTTPPPVPSPEAKETGKATPRVPLCPHHHTPMRCGKDGGWYCPRKDGAGWCKERMRPEGAKA